MNFINNNDFYQRINDAIFPLLHKIEQNTRTDMQTQNENCLLKSRHSEMQNNDTVEAVEVSPPRKITVFPFSFQGKKYLIEPSTNFVYLGDFTITPHIWNQKSISITFIQETQYDYEQDLY